MAKGTKEKTMLIDGITYTGYRLKTIKLRGQVSQGLALPISALHLNLDLILGVGIGDDVSERLDVVKYEPPIPAQLAGKMKGNLPSFIPKTDEERIQNIPILLGVKQGEMFYVTEKLDGTSCTFYKKDGVFGVCSRRIDMFETEGNTHWKLARELKVEETLPEGYAIQGEIVGENIQGNPLKQKGQMFYAFNVIKLDTGEYLNFVGFKNFVKDMGLKTVPIAYDSCILLFSMEDILAFAEKQSILNPECLQEGYVFRPLIEETFGKNNERLSFKVISNKWLLKNEQ